MTETVAKPVLSLSAEQAKHTLNILVRISLKGLRNIHKSRLQQLLISQLEDFDKARMAMIEEHAELGEDGKPKVENDNYVMKDQPGWEKAFKALQASFRVEIGIEDPVKEKAVSMGCDLIQSDDCPALNPAESMALVAIVDAFEKAKAPKAEA